MRLHRFYIKGTCNLGEEITITDKDLIHQWQKVFRLSPKDCIILFDGSGFDFVSEIKKISKNEVIVETKEKIVSRFVPEKKIHLFLAIAKKDNFELAVEKCTELGVKEFTPVISERTEKKNINLERARTIVKEASEQSGRGDVPKVNKTVLFSDLVKSKGGEMVMLHTEAEKNSPEFFSANNLNILIGPEGGWSENEIILAKENGAKVLTLGKQILRAETAAISVATMTNL